MVLFLHELRQGRKALLVWAGIISLLLGICIVIYPEMETQMSEINGMFADMGSFSAAFGMDKINFGEFIGYFGVECGNVLGLGGAFYSALLGILALAKEEKEQTAEFLLTHPVRRSKIIGQKLCAVYAQIVILNAAVSLTVGLATLFIGEKPEAKTLALLLFAHLILQVEIASICFGISAFLSRSGPGAGLGIAAFFYFLNILANLTRKAEFLKYLTPFGYAESAEIIAKGKIEAKYLAVGLAFALLGIAAAFGKYRKKDIL